MAYALRINAGTQITLSQNIEVGLNVGDYLAHTIRVVEPVTGDVNISSGRSGYNFFKFNHNRLLIRFGLGDQNFNSNYPVFTVGETYEFKVVRTSATDYEAFINNQSIGSVTEGADRYSLGRIGVEDGSDPPIELLDVKLSTNGGLSVTNHYDINASAHGSEVLDVVSGNNATFEGAWPIDDSQWVYYSQPDSIIPARWQRRVEISDAVTTGVSESGFVALLTEANLPSEIWSIAKNGGDDLVICTDSNGNGRRPIEVVKFDRATQKAIIWFRFDTFNSSTSVWLFYGHPDAVQPDVAEPFGRNAVWVDLDAVFHLNEASGDFINSVGDGNDATVASESGVTRGATGVLAACVDLDGNQNAIIPQGSYWNDLFNTHTISAWCEINGENAGPNIILEEGGIVNGAYIVYRPNPDTFNYGVRVEYSTYELSSTTTFAPNSGFIKVVGTFDNGVIKLFINGVLEDSLTIPYSSIPDHLNSAGIGSVNSSASVDAGTPWFGKISHVKRRQSTTSESFESTEYANQSDPATFWSTGTPEDTSEGSVGNNIINVNAIYSQVQVNSETLSVAMRHNLTSNSLSLFLGTEQNTVGQFVSLSSASSEAEVFAPAISTTSQVPVTTVSSEVTIFSPAVISTTQIPVESIETQIRINTVPITLEAENVVTAITSYLAIETATGVPGYISNVAITPAELHLDTEVNTVGYQVTMSSVVSEAVLNSATLTLEQSISVMAVASESDIKTVPASLDTASALVTVTTESLVEAQVLEAGQEIQLFAVSSESLVESETLNLSGDLLLVAVAVESRLESETGIPGYQQDIDAVAVESTLQVENLTLDTAISFNVVISETLIEAPTSTVDTLSDISSVVSETLLQAETLNLGALITLNAVETESLLDVNIIEIIQQKLDTGDSTIQPITTLTRFVLAPKTRIYKLTMK